MGLMNYFGQVIQEILQNNYLKTNFEIFKKWLVFWTLNAHISRTVNARELNEAILKSSH